MLLIADHTAVTNITGSLEFLVHLNTMQMIAQYQQLLFQERVHWFESNDNSFVGNHKLPTDAIAAAFGQF